jgi:hypothetical protein
MPFPAWRAARTHLPVIEQDEPESEADEPPFSLTEILLQRYLVRELLRCGVCDAPWVPILLRPTSRFYVCSTKACWRPALPARLIEHQAWSRFVRSRGTITQGVPTQRRHGLLKQELRRVVVRAGLILRLEWLE